MSNVTLIEGRKYAPHCLGRVLVLGLGKSGQAALDYLLKQRDEYSRVTQVCVMAGDASSQSAAIVERYRNLGVEVVCDTQEVEGSWNLCIASPGIPEWSRLYQTALQASEELIGEVEFAWRESAAKSVWVAVTGTNGKTTVTSLINHLFHAAGLPSNAVGNIGDPCLEAVETGTTDIYVAEVSSYQLASTVRFAPQVAVILNITPDHLHWHGTYEAYQKAKFKLLNNLQANKNSVAVLDATNDIVRAHLRDLRSEGEKCRGYSLIPVGTKEGISGDMRVACGSDHAAFVDDDSVLHVAFCGEERTLLSTDDLLICGEHNVLNALVASAAAVALGVSSEQIARGLRTFAPLEHRIEPCGVVDQVPYYNDSKATNVDATLKALSSFPHQKLVVLLGGDDKGTDLSELVRAVYEHARVAVCYGAAGERFFESFAASKSEAPDGFQVIRASRLRDAFDIARLKAGAGDVVLLSPACASFDEFSCFEERGLVFKGYVAEALKMANQSAEGVSLEGTCDKQACGEQVVSSTDASCRPEEGVGRA